MGDLLNKREAALKLRVSERTLDYLRERGKIGWVQWSGTGGVRFRPEQLDEFISRHEHGRPAVA